MSNNKNNNNSQKVISLLVILFLVVFLVVPIGALFLKAFQNFNGDFVGIDNFKEYLLTKGFRIALKNSIKVAVISTFIAMVIAFSYAYGINRSNFKFKGMFHWLALLPIFAPTMTHGIALIYLFGKKGILTNLLHSNFEIYGMWGIIISEIIYIFPVLYLMFSLGLKNSDNRIYEAAEVMGTSKVRQFFTITIPGLKFTLITAFFSSFTMAFTDFGAPKIIGGNFSVLATEVYKKLLGQQDLEMGAVVGVILIIPAVIAFIVDYIIGKKNKVGIDSESTVVIVNNNKNRDLICTIINSVIGVIIITIFTTIIFSAFVTNWPYELTFTTKWFSFSVAGMSGFRIFGNSILVALLTAIFGTIICFTAAYLCERARVFQSFNKWLYFLGILPNAIPGLTVGIAFMFFFNKGSNPLNFI